MTAVDWIIIGFILLMAGWGYSQGLIVGALSFAGFAGGAFVGARFVPQLFDDGSSSPYAPLFALFGALILGGIFASGFELLGFHLRRRLGDRLGLLDGVGGALFVAAIGLGLVWIAGAVALQTPGARQMREPIQRSLVLQELNTHLPPSGSVLRLLARFDPFPRITGPAPGVRPPNPRIARDPQVAAASRSVVKVLGTACGLGVQGSGWVARDGTIVTNAHVVAGQDDTTVQVAGQGPHHDAQAILFDPRNDLAVLQASGVSGVPALGMAPNAAPGTSSAILGFPENGPYTVTPGRLGPTTTVISEDAYGRGPIRRRITSVRGRVRSGNSGGPAVDGNGRVVTTIFAATVSDGGGNGFGVPDTIVRDALARARGPVDTGPCAR